MRQPEARNPPRRPRLWRRLVRLPAARLRAARSRVHTQTHHTPSNSESSPGLFGRFCVFVHRGRAPRSPAARPREAPASRSGRSARPRRHRHSPRRHSCHTDRLRAWRERHEARTGERQTATIERSRHCDPSRGAVSASAARTEITCVRATAPAPRSVLADRARSRTSVIAIGFARLIL